MVGLIFDEELCDASRRVLLDDVFADLHASELFAWVQAGTVYEELGTEAEARLEGVTKFKLRSVLSVEDIRGLARKVKSLRYVSAFGRRARVSAQS